MAKAEKAAAVAELKNEFESSSGAVLTEYRGLTVAQLKELRTNLGENARFAVVKNTLTKRAAGEAGVDEQFRELLEGPSAIAFVKGDVVEAAKGLRDFAKANPHLVIKGGFVDGQSMDAAEIGKLADLESREVLLAKLAGAMKGSLSNAAALFIALPTQAAQLAEALRAKREAAGETAEAPAPAADEAPADEAPADQAPADEAPATEATAAE
ncbi:50S ribosomal protein L10 [Actinomadura sp. 9N407]|uniref:50S ribosomal protein L10 n=1 Tax=Actinomadura sp. 9N407 TaxID=3375154 RepID=UPI00378F83B2